MSFGPTARTAMWIALAFGCVFSTRSIQAADTIWFLRDRDCEIQVRRHERQEGADHFDFTVGLGTQLLATHSIEPVSLISELKVHVPIRSNQIGLESMLRVVLPRTTDHDRDVPMTLLIEGPSTTRRDQWEVLTIENIVEKLARRVRIEQLNRKSEIDTREAYIDTIVVNVYGNKGHATVDLGNPELSEAAVPASAYGMGFVDDESHSDGPPEVAYQSRQLTVSGAPFFVRAIEENGEDWLLLKRLGFNTVCLKACATIEQMAKAAELDLWVVCPPPRNLDGKQLASLFRRVLAWDLSPSEHLPAGSATLDAANQLRQTDGGFRLPMVTASDSDEQLLRLANIVNLRHTLLGTSTSFDEYVDWLQFQIGSPGWSSMQWAEIETQPCRSLTKQLQALGYGRALQLDMESLRLHAIVAAAHGVRGLRFASRNSLSAKQESTRRLALQQINLELSLLEPWLAAGTTTVLPSIGSPSAVATRIQGPRSAIVVHSKFSPKSQMCLEPRDETERTILVPGLMEGAKIFELSPSGLLPLTATRTVGGTEVRVAEPYNVAMLLITTDQNVVRVVADKVNQLSKFVADVTRQQIKEQIQNLRKDQLMTPELEKAYSEYALASVRNEPTEFHRQAASLARRIQWSRYQHWQSCQSSRRPYTAHPLGVLPSTATANRTDSSFDSARVGTNLLKGGDCERLSAMRSAGWQIFTAERLLPVKASASVDPRAEQGFGCLRLHAASAGHIPTLAPTVWATSPQIPIDESSVFQIEGRIKVSPEGPGRLLIFDSVGGPCLGIPYSGTDGWRRFSMVRAAHDARPVTLTFALQGCGEAWIDDVTLTTLSSSSQTRSAMASR